MLPYLRRSIIFARYFCKQALTIRAYKILTNTILFTVTYQYLLSYTYIQSKCKFIFWTRSKICLKCGKMIGIFFLILRISQIFHLKTHAQTFSKNWKLVGVFSKLPSIKKVYYIYITFFTFILKSGVLQVFTNISSSFCITFCK